MKNTNKLLGIIAMLAVISFSMIACGEEATTPIAPTITTASLPGGSVGAAYSQTLAATGDTPITWSIASGTLPAGLTLTAATGVISGTPTVAGSSSFTVKATNGAGNDTKALSITIVLVAPSITTTNLPNGSLDDPYSQTLTATGTAPITWSLDGSGTLPAGLTLAETTGVISGTPTELGTSTFTVKATNDVESDTKQLSIAITPPPPVITTTSLPGGSVGAEYSQTLAATGDTITWSIASGSLPAGLNLADATGVISGTPTTEGTSNFTVRATNNGGQNDKALSIVIVAAVITTAEMITIDSPVIGFETDTITLVNGGQPNYWVRGTAAAKTGAFSLYITNNGTTNAYVTTVASSVHAYVDAEVPADGAFLQFNYRVRGETASGSGVDLLRIYTAPTTTIPEAGSGNTVPTGATLAKALYSISDTIWGECVIAIPDTYKGTTVRIIFTWRNDANTGSQPPAAIDNIKLVQYVTDNTELTPTKLSVDTPAITFESENPLILVNGSQPNYWTRGTAIAKDGSNSLYITNDGTANAYTTTIESVVHAYIDAVIPADGAKLRFNWKAQGEVASGSGVDYLRVYVAPTTTIPIAGTGYTAPNGGPPGATSLTNLYNGGTGVWGEPVIDIPAANNGSTVRIIFTWRNDSNSGAQPPVAIDNIQLVTYVAGSTETETKLTVDSPAIDFESGNPLTLVNGSQPNYWVRGTATAKGGSNSLYITNDGSANAYTTTVNSVVHAYIDAVIPAGGAKLQFNWKAQGEVASGSGVDYLRVYVAPTTTVPIAGTGYSTTAATMPPGAANLGNYYNGGADVWGEPVINIPATNNGTTVRIIFTWRNDANSGSQPSVAIDNIQLIAQ